MADLAFLVAAAEDGLSGHMVRGMADNAAPASEPAVEAVAKASMQDLAENVRRAADFIGKGIDLATEAVGNAVDVASDKAFESAANIGTHAITDPQVQSGSHYAFSWSGYIQALGILCLILAALWFAVWLMRRFGKFNFLPRPGSLPKDALVMEAQMPIGPRKGLMVVRFLNKRLLLGVTERQITLLAEEKAQQDERPEKDFQGIMQDARNANNHAGIDDTSA